MTRREHYEARDNYYTTIGTPIHDKLAVEQHEKEFPPPTRPATTDGIPACAALILAAIAVLAIILVLT